MRKRLLDPLFPYNSTFGVLSCKIKKTKLWVPCNLTSPPRRIRENGEKLILPSFVDFCLSEIKKVNTKILGTRQISLMFSIAFVDVAVTAVIF